MTSKLEKIDTNKVKLEINVAAEQFEEGIDKAFLKQRKKFNIPGFRKGKAPRKMVENFYGGPELFYEDAFEEIFPDAYREAVEEHKLEVVSRPENVDITAIGIEEGVVFSAEVYLKPEIKLGKYDGIKVKRPIPVVADEDVEAEIEKAREQNSRWVNVEREVADGDTVIIDYSGSVDGEKFDGGTAEKQSLVIGSKRFIPGFEEQLVGMKKGEEKKIFVKFPDEYAPELAGKDAVFEIKLHETKEKELPELDDEFAEDVSEFDTFAEYKEDVKKRMTKQAEDKSRVAVENQLLETLAKDAEMDIPDVMIENEIEYQLQQLSYQMMYSGLKLEDYLQYSGKTMEELREDYRFTSTQQVRMRLAVEELIKELKIEPTEEEAEARLEELAKEAGKTVQEYKNMMGAQELDYFKDRVAMERVFDYLSGKAEIEDVDAAEYYKEDAEKKAAKEDEEAAEEAQDEQETADKKTEKLEKKKKAKKEPAAE